MLNKSERFALLRELLVADCTPARRAQARRELLAQVDMVPAMARDRGRVVRTQAREVYGFVPRPPSRAPQLAGLVLLAALFTMLTVLLCRH